MPDNLFAHTAPGAAYPGYVSINREESGDVSFTVRAAPTERDGVHICAHARDAGPGRCVAGGPTCNNYCNMAPEKGPMQDSPLPCVQVFEGKTASFTVPAEAAAALFPKGSD
jgi:hypothetical protein